MRLKSQSLLLTIDYVPALKHELTQGRSNTIVKYKRRQSDEDCPIRSIIYKFVEIKILYQIMWAIWRLIIIKELEIRWSVLNMNEIM